MPTSGEIRTIKMEGEILKKGSLTSALLASAALLLTVSCQEKNQQLSGPDTSQATPENITGAWSTRADFESRDLDWPLTADQARLGCTDTSRWAEVGGVKYALNGRAKGQGYRPIEPVWRIDEEMTQMIRDEFERRGVSAEGEPPVRIDIGDMIEEAGKLCG